jgi:predicted transcriptional regulator of viral defense system
MNKQATLSLFKKGTGYLYMRELKAAGVQPRVIAGLVRGGLLEKIKSGLYRLSNAPDGDGPRSYYDVAAAIPKGVICLQSALAYYGLTTQNPGEIWVAVPNSYRPPTISFPPIKLIFFRGHWYSTGINTVYHGRNVLHIYSPEKSICDAFHLRNRIGEDIAIEALKNYLARKNAAASKLIKIATICGLKNILMPYLKVMVA